MGLVGLVVERGIRSGGAVTRLSKRGICGIDVKWTHDGPLADLQRYRAEDDEGFRWGADQRQLDAVSRRSSALSELGSEAGVSITSAEDLSSAPTYQPLHPAFERALRQRRSNERKERAQDRSLRSSQMSQAQVSSRARRVAASKTHRARFLGC